MIDPVENFIRSHGQQPPSLANLEQAIHDAQRLDSHLKQHAGDIAAEQAIQARYMILRLSNIVLSTQEVTLESPLFTWARTQILAGVDDPDPEVASDNEEPFNGILFYRCRIEAAKGLRIIVHREGGVESAIARNLCKLAADPVPEVRYQVAIDLNSFHAVDESLAWELAEQLAREERQVKILAGCLEYGVWNWIAQQPARCCELVEIILDRLEREEFIVAEKGNYTEDTKELQHELGMILAHIGLLYNHVPARELLTGCLQNMQMFGPLLGASVASVARDLASTTSELEASWAAIRQRVIGWFSQVLERSLSVIEDLDNQLRLGKITQDEARPVYQEAIELEEEIAMRVYFALGLDGNEHFNRIYAGGTARQDFLIEGRDLLANLMRVQHAKVVSHLVRLLHTLLPYNPSCVIELAEQLLGLEPNGKLRGYHIDELIWSDVFTFARAVLSDHPDTLQNLSTAGRLMHILNAYVEGGWPNALDILDDLEGVWR
jgi:hypothetical protein